jgi:putative DNA primase/helicase
MKQCGFYLNIYRGGNMADLTNILGGPWQPPAPQGIVLTDPPEVQLISAIESAGMTAPERIIMDGKIHRFNSGTKGKGGHDRPGWYVVYGDGVPAGRFGCWRAGIEQTWRADIGRKLTVAEEMANSRRMAEAIKVRDAEIAKAREVASNVVDEIWINAGAASADHPYLARKGVQPHGSRVTGDGRLIVPIYDADGQLSSLQYISSDGQKKYHQGGATGSCFWSIGVPAKGDQVYLAEGFATAATIHEVTGKAVFIAYSANNLVNVTGILRQEYDHVVIVADNDKSGVGLKEAEQAAAKYGARVVMPPIEGDANDYVQAGHDLLALLEPKSDDWLIKADDFCSKPAPISWLVKHWLQSNALIMVHGPSGGGKTFVVLDMCLRIALKDNPMLWAGNRVTQGTVVYLAGEGHHGLRGRIAAWKQHHAGGDLDMYLSKDGCDLNKLEGYRRVSDAIRHNNIKPSIIVVDTLHRFLSGDENSAQDAKTMLDACGGLMAEFNCSVLLVHHTGVSEEAQHRARGSSAWRGALDIEISIVPPKSDDAPIEIVQRKSKDAEMSLPIFVNLKSVPINGWLDEDSEQVTSAVIVPADAPAKTEKMDKLSKHKKLFEAAWWSSGAEEREGHPYVSRSAFIEYLVSNQGLTEGTAKMYTKPSVSGKPVNELLISEIIASHEHGWIMLDEVAASAMMMRKTG